MVFLWNTRILFALVLNLFPRSCRTYVTDKGGGRGWQGSLIRVFLDIEATRVQLKQEVADLLSTTFGETHLQSLMPMLEQAP